MVHVSYLKAEQNYPPRPYREGTPAGMGPCSASGSGSVSYAYSSSSCRAAYACSSCGERCSLAGLIKLPPRATHSALRRPTVLNERGEMAMTLVP